MTTATAIQRDITIGDCRLILGDMRAVLPELRESEGVRAHMVLSDPPYALTSGGNTTGEMGGCFAKGRYDNSGALFDLVDWSDMAPLIREILRDDADAVIMTSDRELHRAQAAFMGAGFGFHRLLVWDKVTATPNRWYMPNAEFALYLYVGAARRIADCASKSMIRVRQKDVSQWFHGPDVAHAARVAHPTEKPVELMRYWLENSTRVGELVVDPFMGAGSTLLAAAATGRCAIGIEKDEKWFNVAVARLQAALNEPSFDLSAPAKSAEVA
ncbi:MAG TPA: site-specific DNA-methyltransferase [Aliiroseovarius sp.]|nr:site-specific DNA-methyltransferase [Aliiroseovarius sp.]